MVDPQLAHMEMLILILLMWFHVGIYIHFLPLEVPYPFDSDKSQVVSPRMTTLGDYSVNFSNRFTTKPLHN
jgi:hypothetical protein